VNAENTQQNMSTLKCQCHPGTTRMTKSDQLGPLMNKNNRSRCRKNPTHIVNSNQLHFHKKYCENTDTQVCPHSLQTIGWGRMAWMQQYHDTHIHDIPRIHPPLVNILNEEYSEDTRMWGRVVQCTQLTFPQPASHWEWDKCTTPLRCTYHHILKALLVCNKALWYLSINKALWYLSINKEWQGPHKYRINQEN
jgi:hypothetical protein